MRKPEHYGSPERAFKVGDQVIFHVAKIDLSAVVVNVEDPTWRYDYTVRVLELPNYFASAHEHELTLVSSAYQSIKYREEVTA